VPRKKEEEKVEREKPGPGDLTNRRKKRICGETGIGDNKLLFSQASGLKET